MGSVWGIELDERGEWAVGRIARGCTRLRVVEEAREKWGIGRVGAERLWEWGISVVSAGCGGREAQAEAKAGYDAVLERLRVMEEECKGVEERRRVIGEERMVMGARDRVMGLGGERGERGEMVEGGLGQMIADEMSRKEEKGEGE